MNKRSSMDIQRSATGESDQSASESMVAPLAGEIVSQAGEVDEDESEEAAAKRRQATLARLRAGGSLGRGMFDSHPVESDEVEEQEILQQEPAPEVNTPATRASMLPETVAPSEQLHHHGLPAPPAEDQEEEEADTIADEEEDEAPPPVPRRSMDVGTVPASPHRSTSIRSDSRQSITRSPSTSRQNLAAPLDISITASNLVYQEPANMSPISPTLARVGEESDEPGPPPPPRSPAVVTRSESRASRVSMSSRRSSGAVPVRQSSTSGASAGRPNYNELEQASKQYGSQVLRVANVLCERNRRGSVGVSVS